jgi:hypothetical protein
MYSVCAISAALLVVLVIIVAFAAGGAAKARYSEYLSGHWVGDPAFLASSGLRDVQLFIAPEESGERQGYLIMANEDGDFVANQAVTITAQRSDLGRWAAARAALAADDARTLGEFDFAFDAPSADAPFPARVKISVSILRGTLTVFDETSVYAFLRKDLSVSESAVEAYAS